MFSAIGATLAIIGIIPKIAAIEAVVTAVLSGITGTIAGGVTGYLINAAINQCCGSQKCATQ
ncbi:hypothetical protein [Wolbachia endosymbiont of Wuchereria bancrofti]|uniref:hypothetical protein n=1 Tax=Wolbachia endosymbiont of Wuchereria bancrofti TaxID=96496 RepID=UPI00034A2C49|nr:hypothetical protein [Wolbachia endosymbiont of Wuchereria bancrofti]